jgi:sporulation protein YlmC with PRC-barrel domain
MTDELAIDETDELIASNKVEGTPVYNPDGERLGTILNFMVDKRSGKAAYAVLSFGGFLGLGEDYYPLPWEMLDYDPDRHGYIVDISRDALEAAPGFSSGAEPVFDRAYGQNIYTYYGVPFIY